MKEQITIGLTRDLTITELRNAHRLVTRIKNNYTTAEEELKMIEETIRILEE